MSRVIHFVLDGPPGPEAGRFVDTENPDGTGTSAGEWVQRDDGTWALSVRVVDGKISPEDLRIKDGYGVPRFAGPITDGGLIALGARARQIELWGPDHDTGHDRGELTSAARCYVMAAEYATRPPQKSDGRLPAWARDQGAAWPFEEAWWKPSADPVDNLAKAAALLIAEIDRIQAGRIS